VRVWLWFHFNDFIDSAVYTRDFPMYAQWGIAGLKIDFIDRDDQWARQVVRKTSPAQRRRKSSSDRLPRRIQAPPAWERTWPNQITREGIQGNEYTSGA